MLVVVNVEQPQSIAAAFLACQDLYRRLYLSLAGHEAQAADQIDLADLSDNYGRLNIWGSDSGALRTGSGSLDDILRADDNLRAIVHDLFGDLTEALNRVILLTKGNEHVGHGDGPVGDNSGEDSLSSISTPSEETFRDVGKSYPKQTEIQYLVSHIFEQIRSLYKFSVLLRRPSIHEKYIRSVSKDKYSSCFVFWDQAHVRNKFSSASEVLVCRLGLANTRRRQQLRYWENHHENAADRVPLATRPQTGTQGSGYISAPTYDAPSRTTKESFSTVVQSVINDSGTQLASPQTIYPPSSQGQGHYLRVPDPPK
ncbi:MAG: hypothetical protein Q9225_006987, partial [Loekoesia sp. 1 TL-2023]